MVVLDFGGLKGGYGSDTIRTPLRIPSAIPAEEIHLQVVQSVRAGARPLQRGPYLTLHEVTLGLVLLGEEAHAVRPAAVVNLHDVGQRSQLVLDPSQLEDAKENHGALKVQLRGMYIGVVSSV
jgi:hypothetical protein